MNTKLMFLKSLSMALLLCTAAAAQADITVFTNRASFLAAVFAPGTDSFDNVPVGQEIMAFPSLFRAAGPYGYRLNTERFSFTGIDGGGGDTWLSSYYPSGGMVFWNIHGIPRAMGGSFFKVDSGGAVVPDIALTVQVLTPSGRETVRIDNATPDSFIGFTTSAQIMDFRVLSEDGLYRLAMNNVTIAVPEPANYGMLLAGLCLVGGLARRRAG
jgi:hypothetical protein